MFFAYKNWLNILVMVPYKVLPIRPGLDPKWLGIKTPFSKKYRMFEKKNYGQISITGPDLDPENIGKFDGRFGRQILHFFYKKKP